MKTCIVKNEFRVYQETLREYVNSDEKQVIKECEESVDMDDNKPAVEQFWVKEKESFT